MDTPPAGSAVTTPAQLLEAITELKLSVRELTGDVRRLTEALPDHEARIRALEQAVARRFVVTVSTTGASGLIGALITFLTTR